MSFKNEVGSVEITSPMHLLAVGEALALMTVLRDLEEQQEKFPVPGLAFAIQALRAQDADNRMKMMQKNFRKAAKCGADLSSHTVMLCVENEKVLVSWGNDEESEAAA